MTVFYQALKEPKDNTTKQMYELWRQKVGEHRSYIDSNKLDNVRRDAMKKNKLTGDLEESKTYIRQPTNVERQDSQDARVWLENLTPEQAGNTIEQVRQGNGINNINQPVRQEEWLERNEAFIVENIDVIEEEKIEVLEEFFQTQNMNINERETETNKKRS